MKRLWVDEAARLTEEDWERIKRALEPDKPCLPRLFIGVDYGREHPTTAVLISLASGRPRQDSSTYREWLATRLRPYPAQRKLLASTPPRLSTLLKRLQGMPEPEWCKRYMGEWHDADDK